MRANLIISKEKLMITAFKSRCVRGMKCNKKSCIITMFNARFKVKAKEKFMREKKNQNLTTGNTSTEINKRKCHRTCLVFQVPQKIL